MPCSENALCPSSVFKRQTFIVEAAAVNCCVTYARVDIAISVLILIPE